uniref:Centromere protein S n=1 Tax=Chrysemys picta bellii TaxID=8478 RepID=A0A8C3IDR1_CHRPI
MEPLGEQERERLLHTQRLKAAVHYTVGCLCQEVAEDKGIQFSKQTIAAISEITFRQCEHFAKDLEMFARHGKRTVINSEDVKLLARRSNSLYWQELTDVKRRTLLTFLSALADWISQMEDASLMEEVVELANRQERSAFHQPRAWEKSPCRNFFWKTFSSC